MSLTIYHNPKCSKSRETLKLLTDRGLTPQIVEYLKTPLSVEQLTDIVRKLQRPAAVLVRKKEAAEAGLIAAELDDAEIVAALARHPSVLERPIVVAGDKAALGRPPEAVLEILEP